jgi:hypothetical protein
MRHFVRKSITVLRQDCLLIPTTIFPFVEWQSFLESNNSLARNGGDGRDLRNREGALPHCWGWGAAPRIEAGFTPFNSACLRSQNDWTEPK